MAASQKACAQHLRWVLDTDPFASPHQSVDVKLIVSLAHEQLLVRGDITRHRQAIWKKGRRHQHTHNKPLYPPMGPAGMAASRKTVNSPH